MANALINFLLVYLGKITSSTKPRSTSFQAPDQQQPSSSGSTASVNGLSASSQPNGLSASASSKDGISAAPKTSSADAQRKQKALDERNAAKQKLLKEDPGLHRLSQELVGKKALSAADFWSEVRPCIVCLLVGPQSGRGRLMVSLKGSRSETA